MGGGLIIAVGTDVGDLLVRFPIASGMSQNFPKLHSLYFSGRVSAEQLGWPELVSNACSHCD